MSKIKILKISSLYDTYLNYFKEKNADLGLLTYQSHHDRLMSDCFGLYNLWQKTLEKTGRYVVYEVIGNCLDLQKKWLKEHQLTCKEDNILEEIISYQIECYKPEIIFLLGFNIVSSDFVEKLKTKYKFLKILIGYDGIGRNDKILFKNFDLILSCLPETANFYNNKEQKGVYFPLAFDKEILDKINFGKDKINFSFTGSLFKGEGYHNRRIEDIYKLLYSDLSFKIYTNDLFPNQMLSKDQIKRLLKLRFSEFYKKITISNSIKPAVFGLDMFQTLADSKISFNSHIDGAKNNAANMRLFEVTGVGSCLITEYKENINDFFDVDNDIVTYKSIDECIDKVKNLLSDDKLRKKIALNGQKKTLKDHSYEQRILDFEKNVLNFYV